MATFLLPLLASVASNEIPRGHLLKVAGLEHLPHLGVVNECTGDRCPGSVEVVDGTTLRLTGNQRLYLVEDARGGLTWDQLTYVRMPLSGGGEFAFTADISDVRCNCNAAIYLVAMPEPRSGSSCYCDITYGSCGSPCVEVDLLESNVEVAQTTLHAYQGNGADGTCNTYGCAVNWGHNRETPLGWRTADLWGSRGIIDTSEPYRVQATFENDGELRTTLTQVGACSIELGELR
jgi:hypothetical protein